MDYLKRAERRSIPVEDEYFLIQKDNSPTLEEKVLDNEIKHQLLERCNQLQSPYKEIALDYFYYEISAADIAGKTGKNLKTVQTQIYRAKAMLRKKYEKEAVLK